jgi:putative hemolysin
VLKLMGMTGGPSRAVTEEEIAASLEEGVDAGVIEAQEHQMVRNVFRLDDRQIGSMMIPRAEIVWLDEADSLPTLLELISTSGHSRFPVCRGSLDDVRGVLGVASLLQPLSNGQPLVLADHLQPPVFVPETLSGMELLEHFRRARTDIVFVVDEYGGARRDHRTGLAGSHHR